MGVGSHYSRYTGSGQRSSVKSKGWGVRSALPLPVWLNLLEPQSPHLLNGARNRTQLTLGGRW